jgi:hypothetical protein
MTTAAQRKNTNPIVMWGPCVKCGDKVALFKKDEADYLANPARGLIHVVCILDRERS